MYNYCIYLRKSRADEEAEKFGEGETLSKHRSALLKLATDMKITVGRIFEEIVSGESLIHRPEMLSLLKEIQEGRWTGVLCMDMDRLGRGNMQEQGLILETFKSTNTKIITPRKTYDLSNEFDEEYSEFEAFMARKELKLINRRLQRGRIRSVEEGNYIGTFAPFGYEICFEGKYRSLKPHPEQANVVVMIFDMYVNQGMGCSKLANTLNSMGIKTYTGRKWSAPLVAGIIKNPVYTGVVTWNKKKSQKSTKEGCIKEVKAVPKAEWLIADGKHEAIISKELYSQAQKILSSRYHVPYNIRVTNPLAGILKCKICGSNMIYRPFSKSEAHIMCIHKCGNKSSKFRYVEDRLISELSLWLNEYKLEYSSENNLKTSDNLTIKVIKNSIKNAEKELSELEKQKNNLHDFLERGIYDDTTYLERSKSLAERIEKTTAIKRQLQQDIDNEDKCIKAGLEIMPMLHNILRLYQLEDDPAEKNLLLKCVVEKVIYQKSKEQRNDDFSLEIMPKIEY